MTARLSGNHADNREENKTMFGIWCTVSGGITGHRTSWLKIEGQVQEYASFQEADAIAADLERRANSQNAVANFRYQPRPLDTVGVA